MVWQTGTVEAVRRLPPEEFARTLDAGAEAARAAGADLVLVDPQYSRMLQSHTTLAPYRETMQQAARRHAAVLFRRFDLIRQWVEAGAARPGEHRQAGPVENGRAAECLPGAGAGADRAAGGGAGTDPQGAG